MDSGLFKLKAFKLKQFKEPSDGTQWIHRVHRILLAKSHTVLMEF